MDEENNEQLVVLDIHLFQVHLSHLHASYTFLQKLSIKIISHLIIKLPDDSQVYPKFHQTNFNVVVL